MAQRAEIELKLFQVKKQTKVIEIRRLTLHAVQTSSKRPRTPDNTRVFWFDNN